MRQNNTLCRPCPERSLALEVMQVLTWDITSTGIHWRHELIRESHVTRVREHSHLKRSFARMARSKANVRL